MTWKRAANVGRELDAMDAEGRSLSGASLAERMSPHIIDCLIRQQQADGLTYRRW